MVLCRVTLVIARVVVVLLRSIREFNPDNETWTAYTEKLEEYFLTNNIESAEKQSAKELVNRGQIVKSSESSEGKITMAMSPVNCVYMGHEKLGGGLYFMSLFLLFANQL